MTRKMTFVFDDATSSLLEKIAEQFYGGNKSLALRRAVQALAREHRIGPDVSTQGWVILGYVAEEVPQEGAECHSCGRHFKAGQVLYRPVFHRAKGTEAEIWPLLPEEPIWECPFCVEGEDDPDRVDVIKEYEKRYWGER